MKLTFFLSCICFFAGSVCAQPGTIDTTFCHNGIDFNATIDDVCIQKDQKIIACGAFTSVNGIPLAHLVRMSESGVIENGFVRGSGFDGGVTRIVQQADGKLIVGGDFLTYNGDSCFRIVRLNADGTRDTTFHTGKGFNQAVTYILIQPDKKIIVGGKFTTFDGQGPGNLVRLNSNGNQDVGFSIGSGFTPVGSGPVVQQFVLQKDKKIIVIGDFKAINGKTCNHIARLQENGSVDNSYITQGLDDSPYRMLIQPDEKVVVAGAFTQYAGKTANGIVRILPTGRPDSSGFVTGTGFNSIPFSIALLNDQSILVTGPFSKYNGSTANGYARLSNVGIYISSFTLSSNLYGINFSNIALQPDGKIILENIRDLNPSKRNGLVRLNMDWPAGTASFPQPKVIINSLPDNQYKVQCESPVVEFRLFNSSGQELRVACDVSNGLVSLDNQRSGTYILQITTKSGIVRYHLVK